MPSARINAECTTLWGVAMAGRQSRCLGFALVAGAGAGLLSLTSIMDSAFAYGSPVDTDPVVPFEVMGGSGVPIPSQQLIDEVQALYFPSSALFPGQPTFNADPVGLDTPEQFYPITGVNSLPLDTSVAEGVTILNNTIASDLANGDTVGVFGISQSAVIASLEMEELEQEGLGGTSAEFVLTGDLMNPNGGIFERFDSLNLPSLGIDFYGATPSDDFPTTIYTLEYDGYADFCEYPGDLLCDLNAIEGMSTVHPTYPDLTATQLDSAVLLPGSEALGADSLTNYYIIPTDDLPLLDPVREIPVIGNPLADLLQPDLTYLVNLGYGDPLYGWSTSAADVATPFGLFPSLSDFEMMPGLLVSGTEEGIENFIGDFTGTGPNPVDLSLGSLTSLLESSSGTTSALPDLSTALAALASDPALPLTDFANALSTVASAAYGTLLPTADIADALVTSIPAYDASLFLDNLSDPVNAIGLPIAADMALVPLMASFELTVIGDAASTIASAIIP
jgi:hypothetical protein